MPLPCSTILPLAAVDQLERGVELIDLAGRVAGDLDQLIRHAFLDDDVELVARRSRVAAAGRGEDQLVAELLSDAAGIGVTSTPFITSTSLAPPAVVPP